MTESRSITAFPTGRFVLTPTRRLQWKCTGSCPICNVGLVAADAPPFVCTDCVDHAEKSRQFPFILLGESSDKASEIGKYDFLKALQAACRYCGTNKQICNECAEVIKWAKPSIPSRLIRLQVDDAPGRVQIWVRAAPYATKHYVQLVTRGEVVTLNTVRNIETSDNSSANNDTSNTWMGPWYMYPGDVLRFRGVPEHYPQPKSRDAKPAALEFQLCKTQPFIVKVALCANRSTTSGSNVDLDAVTDASITARTDSETKSSSTQSLMCHRYGEALKTLHETSVPFLNNSQSDGRDDMSCDLSLESQHLESQWPETYPNGRTHKTPKHVISPQIGVTTKKQCKYSESSFPDEGPEVPVVVFTNDAKHGRLEVERTPTNVSGVTGDDAISTRWFMASFISTIKKSHEVDIGEASINIHEEPGNLKVYAIVAPVVTHEPTTMELSTTIASRSACTQQIRNIPGQSTPSSSRQKPETVALPLSPETLTDEMQPKPPTMTTHTSTRSKGKNLCSEATVERTETPIPSPSTQVIGMPVHGEKKFILYFVEKGRDMHNRTHIPGLRLLAEQRGARVLDMFNKNEPSTWPTHFVMSQKVTARESLASALGFRDLDEMTDFVHEHRITCATRAWAASRSFDKTQFKEPTMIEQIVGFRRTKSCRNTRRARAALGESSLNNNPKVKQSNSAGAIARNVALSGVFHKLSKLHQQCPLYLDDDWKAYTFQLLSGRLRHIDFEVVNDPSVLMRLKNVSGFGDSSMQIVKEFLETGHSTRIHEFETNKLRVAMKSMMNIWGVGRVRASELVNAGYMRVGSVRQAVANGTLRLERNQYIGLMCYEDIMEEMPRIEVEAIAKIVADAAKIRFPSAELTIMGSYRRGKLTCGDADILITHRDYVDQVGSTFLGKIVDDLCANGHVAHHLTFISGMKKENFETLPKTVASKLTNPGSYGRSIDKNDKTTSSSWMGVFHSPLIPGRHRRVDIKFYPYVERVFAALYFTGNGHFNRSMRLWATRKKNCTLSDHGLVNKTSRASVLLDPESEMTVFAFLGLKWKEPSQRDCFDAVEGVDGELASLLPKVLTQAEVAEENRTHVWIE